MDKIVKTDNLQGKFLLSYPNIPDNRFFQTVIYIASHTDKGVEGIILNKRSAFNFTKLVGHVNGLKMESIAVDPEEFNKFKVSRGGPVNGDKVYILHSNEHVAENSVLTAHEVYYTNNVALVQDMLHGKSPQKVSFYIGNCTWSTKQLQEELKSDSWFVVDATDETAKTYIFESEENLWKTMCEGIGVKQTNPSFFASQALSISLQ